MTDLTDQTAAQALARSLLVIALDGASLYWARVHGYVIDCAPEEMRAEGIHIKDHSVWSVDLDDITQAITELITHPELVAALGAVSDSRTLPYVSSTLATARQQGVRRVADLATADADYSASKSTSLSPTSSSSSPQPATWSTDALQSDVSVIGDPTSWTEEQEAAADDRRVYRPSRRTAGAGHRRVRSRTQ